MSATLWNHTMEGAYPPEQLAEIPGVWRYGARALCCTNPKDTIQLHADLQEEFSWISEHYRRIGLPHSTNVLWNADLQAIRTFPNHAWEVFLFSNLHEATKSDATWFETTRAMNEKNEFIALCQRHGWAVPRTYCFDNAVCAARQLDRLNLQYPLYRKTSCSAAGEGVVQCCSRATLDADLESMPPGIALQLQESTAADSRFINVQYRVVDGQVERVAITDQVLDGFAHAGNRYPAVSEEGIWELCDPAAQEIAKMGMKSYFAFDVAAGSGQQAVLIECNPRWNACTYYWKVAQRFGISNWECRNLSVPFDSLNRVNLEAIEFDPLRKKGVVVVSWGTILDRKIGVLLAGETREEVEQFDDLFRAQNGG